MTNTRHPLAALLLLAGALALPFAHAADSATGQRVQAYYGGYAWHLPDYQAPQHVDMSAMTHFVFARIGPGGGQGGGAPGDIVLGAHTAQTRKDLGPGAPLKTVEDYLVGRAHAAGVKAMIMLGGAGDNDGFRASTQPAVRSRFVRNLIDYCVAHDYDGIDVDWEGIPQAATGDQALLEALIAELRAEAATRTRYRDKPILISFAADALNPNYQRVLPHHARVARLVDYFNVMTYGMAWFGSGWNTGTFAPINGRSATRPLDIANSLAMYEAGGVPRAKLAMGIGLYGMSYQPPYFQPGVPTSGDASAFSANDVLWNYAQLHKHGYLSRGSYVFDEVGQIGYRSYPQGYTPATRPSTTSGYISYEDERSIAAKGRWSRSTKFGEGAAGTIVWLINYGTTNGVDNPLMAAVKKAFLQPGAGDPGPGPTPPTTPVTLSVRTNITSDWRTGYCAAVTVSNPGSAAATDWRVRVPVEGRITTLWNGVYAMEGNTMVLSGPAWARDLAAGASNSSIGFCANR